MSEHEPWRKDFDLMPVQWNGTDTRKPGEVAGLQAGETAATGAIGKRDISSTIAALLNALDPGTFPAPASTRTQPPRGGGNQFIPEFFDLFPPGLTGPPRAGDQFLSKGTPFIPEFFDLFPPGLTGPQGPTGTSYAMDPATLAELEDKPFGLDPRTGGFEGRLREGEFAYGPSKGFTQIDETDIGAVRGELRRLGNELDLLKASEDTLDMPRIKRLSTRIGILETVFEDLKEAKQEAKDVARDKADKEFRAEVLEAANTRADELAKTLADARVAAAKTLAEAGTAAATAAAEARTEAATAAADARTEAATAAADARTALAKAQNEFQAGQSETALASQAALAEAQRTWQSAQAKQTQQFGLLATLLPLFLQQQQQQSQFAQTQGLAQQRFAQEQVQTRRFETERQEELQRLQDQRQQAASLIPQLFPNMEIDEAILAGGIDPSLIPVLISLARLRAEQDVSGQRPTRQPIVTFAR